MARKTKKDVEELVQELKLNYPDYTDEHVNDYADFMSSEGFTRKQINDFIIACDC